MGVAADQWAEITNSVWDTYKTTFYPQEDKAVDYALNPEVIKTGLARTRENMDLGLQNAQTAQNQLMSGFGLSQSSREKSSRDRSSAIEAAASKTAALNGTRGQLQDMQTKMQSGDLSVGLDQFRKAGGGS